jgi:hypothetical protein
VVGPTDARRETQNALAAFASEVKMFFADVETKAKVNEALASWLNNTKYAQYCLVVYSHLSLCSGGNLTEGVP